jgi:hypothetical protein
MSLLVRIHYAHIIAFFLEVACTFHDPHCTNGSWLEQIKSDGCILDISVASQNWIRID